MISRVVVIVVSAVAVANAPVVINNHLLLVNVLTIAKTTVARTIDATTRKATLDTALESLMPLYP
jgi:MoxR-like ATPase